MIDHITIEVSDLEKSKAFYERAFEPLGYGLSFGKEGVFWAFDVGDGSLFEIQHTGSRPPLTHLHVAFRVDSRAEVDAFYRAALEAGAEDNGGPGPRPEYTADYYACFILDPDGYNIEAMINKPGARDKIQLRSWLCLSRPPSALRRKSRSAGRGVRLVGDVPAS